MPVWTVDLVLPECNRDQKTVPEYTASVSNNLTKALEMVRENLHKAAVRALVSAVFQVLFAYT